MDRLWTLPSLIFASAEAYYGDIYSDLDVRRQETVIALLCDYLNMTREDAIRTFRLMTNRGKRSCISKARARHEYRAIARMIETCLYEYAPDVHTSNDDYV